MPKLTRPTVPPTPLEKSPIERMTELALRIMRRPKGESTRPKKQAKKQRRHK
jgi:hypothetical protein